MIKRDKIDDWLKRESDIFQHSMLEMVALIGAILAAQNKELLILGQPFSVPISFSLFLLCIFLRIKYHVLESKLVVFYNQYEQSALPVKKSVEEVREILFLYFGYFLCISLTHFYFFLLAFLVFLSIDQWYNIGYLINQIKERPDWGFSKAKRLFLSWVLINFTNIILTLAAFFLVKVLNINFNLVAYSFIIAIFIIDIIVDWFLLNSDFYFGYSGYRSVE